MVRLPKFLLLFPIVALIAAGCGQNSPSTRLSPSPHHEAWGGAVPTLVTKSLSASRISQNRDT